MFGGEFTEAHRFRTCILASFWVKLDGLAMRRVTVRFGPLFLAHRERGQIGQTLCQSQPFERRQPMFVVMRAIIEFATSAGGSEFFRKSSGPLLPGEMSFFRKLDGQRERLSLPGFGK